MKSVETINLPNSTSVRKALDKMLYTAKEAISLFEVVEKIDQERIHDLDISLGLLGLMPTFKDGIDAAENKDMLDVYEFGIHALYKSMLLDRLFREDFVDTRKIQSDIYRKYDFINGELFNKAALEIYEICKNGNKNTRRGSRYLKDKE